MFPHGAALVAALLVCATSGAAAAGIRLQNRHAQLLGLIAALGAAQLLGHLTLALAGGHHGGGALGMSPDHDRGARRRGRGARYRHRRRRAPRTWSAHRCCAGCDCSPP